MEKKQIVITETSAVTPLGNSLEAVSASLLKPPVTSTVQEFEFHSLEKPVPCYQLPDFDPVEILGKKGLRNKDKATKLLLCTAELGFKAQMEGCDEANRPGLCIGTAFGSLQSIGDFLSDSIVNGVNAVNPQSFANTVINAPTGNTNIRFTARNLSSTIATGFNSGLDAIIYSFDHLQQGYLDRIVAGGLEEISYYALLGLERSGLLSRTGTVLPFASGSDGIVMGEGCALFMVETVNSASNRGAAIQAEIAGCANGFDPAPGKGARSDGRVFARMVRNACEQAGITPEAIDMIASGANGNPVSDQLEAAGIEAVFGTGTPVTAYKKYTGECYGASGAINILCALADMRVNRISGISGDPYPVSGPICPVFGTMEKRLGHVLVTSYSCDGNCSAVILKNVK